MATYSINIGTPTESTKVQDLQTFLNKLPDNTAQLISPRDTRDAIFTTWENILIKETTVASSAIGYIGLDNDTLKAAMLIGKKAYTTQEILDDALLNSDTDLFIFNGKSDSNPSVQDTKVSLLAGLITSDYYLAPYIEATKIVSPSRIDLSIVNPATAGVIEINADQIELGNSGWIINNTGALYPVIDGQDLGATPSNRIGNLYMASRIDYANDLLWTVGNTTNMVLTTGGLLSVDTISASNVYTENLQITTSATAGYVLTSDGIGNALWSPSTGIDSVGITAGYIIVADGLGDTNWASNAPSSAGVDGSVQFTQTGMLSSDDNNFHWDNTNKRLGILTNAPTAELEVVGQISATSFSGEKLKLSYSFGFATAGYGLGKLLTSDAFGNATWEDAPFAITSSVASVNGQSGVVLLGIDDLIDVDTTSATASINDLLTWDGSNWIPITANNTIKKSWSWGASANQDTTDRYLYKSHNTPTNLSPFVAFENCKILNMSASNNGNETWVAETRVNGVTVASISITAANSGWSIINVNVNQGDKISFYCNGSLIDSPSIEILIQEI